MFEKINQEPGLNEFMQQFMAIKGKWQSEGNVDSEFNDADSIKMQVDNGDITPAEGIARLQAIDDGRISR